MEISVRKDQISSKKMIEKVDHCAVVGLQNGHRYFLLSCECIPIFHQEGESIPPLLESGLGLTFINRIRQKERYMISGLGT